MGKQQGSLLSGKTESAEMWLVGRLSSSDGRRKDCTKLKQWILRPFQRYKKAKTLVPVTERALRQVFLKLWPRLWNDLFSPYPLCFPYSQYNNKLTNGFFWMKVDRIDWSLMPWKFVYQSSGGHFPHVDKTVGGTCRHSVRVRRPATFQQILNKYHSLKGNRYMHWIQTGSVCSCIQILPVERVL